MKRYIVVGNHWCELPKPWEVYSQKEIDVTLPLPFKNDSIDCLMSEHMVEHITLPEAIGFFKEALRVLKPGGILRIVMPMYERLMNENLEKAEIYFKNNILPYYENENKILKELDIDIFDYKKPFQLNALYRECGHKFIWNEMLLVNVFHRIGFKEIRVCKSGDGINPEYCIEHRQRGIEMSNDPEKEKKLPFIDNEGYATEAQK